METGDDLYTLAPEEFVAARDALVKQLRSAGDKDEARRVATLRRPTVPAWALNQLARSQPGEIDHLLEAAATLQDRPADVRQAMAAYREAAKDAGTAAARVLRDSGRDPDQHLADIRATLDAAGTDPELAEALRAGRLERAGGSFDAVFPVVDSSARKTASARPAAGEKDAESAREDAGAAAEAARAAQRAEKLDAAEDAVRQRRAELKEADAEVSSAEKALGTAERQLEAATKARERAAAALARAEHSRDQLRSS